MTKELVDSFYRGLAERDGEAMASCYSEDIVFEDPAFGVLKGNDPGDMWRMLCASDTDLTLAHTVGETTPTSATATWVATYKRRRAKPSTNSKPPTARCMPGRRTREAST